MKNNTNVLLYGYDRTELKKRRRKYFVDRLKRGIPIYIMLLFPIAWYVIFCYIPMSGLIIAFKEYDISLGFFGSPWHSEGLLYNFKYFLSYDYFWKVFLNTIELGTVNSLVCFPAPIILALFFNELRQGIFKKTVQTISYIPYFVSTVALISIVILMMNSDGVVNQLRASSGKKPIAFLTTPEYVMPMYVVLNLWRCIGWNTIIYTASMSNISPELYEAADLDGAGRFVKIFKITLPLILPTVIILLILSAPGFISADFETMYLLGNESTWSKSDVLATWIYRLSFYAKGIPDYSLSTAVGLFQSVLNLVVVLSVNAISNKVSDIGLF